MKKVLFISLALAALVFLPMFAVNYMNEQFANVVSVFWLSIIILATSTLGVLLLAKVAVNSLKSKNK
jgi:hypothetical protein